MTSPRKITKPPQSKRNPRPPLPRLPKRSRPPGPPTPTTTIVSLLTAMFLSGQAQGIMGVKDAKFLLNPLNRPDGLPIYNYRYINKMYRLINNVRNTPHFFNEPTNNNHLNNTTFYHFSSNNKNKSKGRFVAPNSKFKRPKSASQKKPTYDEINKFLVARS